MYFERKGSYMFVYVEHHWSTKKHISIK